MATQSKASAKEIGGGDRGAFSTAGKFLCTDGDQICICAWSPSQTWHVLDFPTDRYLRAARRLADLSQRELAEKSGLTQSVVARAEHSPHLARVDQFARLLETAGLRLLVIDNDGREFAPEGEEAANRRDRGRRRYPAHLDVRPGSDGWWGEGWPMFFGKTPTYTFDRARHRRNFSRWWAEQKFTAADSEQSNTDSANREH